MGVMRVRQEARIVALSGSATRLTIRHNPSEGSLLAYFMSSGLPAQGRLRQETSEESLLARDASLRSRCNGLWLVIAAQQDIFMLRGAARDMSNSVDDQGSRSLTHTSYS
jgi:hypothetical protein